MSIAQAVQDIYERIEKACIRAGRKPEEVTLMGVSKFHPKEAVEEAWQAGIRLFGENRVQEAHAKFPELQAAHPDLKVRLIGQLQRNKAKTAISFFDGVQSIDRDELLTELGRLTALRDKPLDILFELHTAEDSKSGYPDLDSLYRAAELALGFPGLHIQGLMTMAPFTSEEGPVRASFKALVSARDKLAARFPSADWSCLSMGMTEDFEIAIEEGSTQVRIGTAIFGPRITA